MKIKNLIKRLPRNVRIPCHVRHQTQGNIHGNIIISDDRVCFVGQSFNGEKQIGGGRTHIKYDWESCWCMGYLHDEEFFIFSSSEKNFSLEVISCGDLLL